MFNNTPEITAHKPTQQDIVIKYMCLMDLDMVETLLGPDFCPIDITKGALFGWFRQAMDLFEKHGDKELTMKPGFCTACCMHCVAFSFIGKQSAIELRVRFTLNNQLITDISICNFFYYTKMIEEKKKVIKMDLTDPSFPRAVVVDYVFPII